MRRIRNRDQKSVVSHGPEGEPAASWGQRLTVGGYMLGLGALAALLLYFVGDRLLHFEVRGQIRVEKTVVSAPRGGIVERFGRAEGDSVEQGDTLAVVDPATLCEEFDGGRMRSVLAEVRRDSLRRQLVSERLTERRARLKNATMGRVLEIGSGTARSPDALRAEIRELEDERRELALELELERAELDSLRASDRPDPRCRPYPVRSPGEGVIRARHRRPGEVVRSGDPLVTVEPPNASVSVLAYLEPDDLEDVKPGETVTVYLPDGTKHSGVVESTYSAARGFPGLKWTGYRPVSASLVAEIRPRSPGQASRWRRLDLLDVKVKG